jgi:hypothetical protein
MVAGANASGIDAVAGEYDCCMAGTPALLARPAIARFRLLVGRNYVSIFFS